MKKSILHDLMPNTGAAFTIIKRHLITGVALIFLFLNSGCSRTGIFSVVISGNVQAENNDLNELHEPYKKKKLVFPECTVSMSETEWSKWNDTLGLYRVHTVDTSFKISIIKTPGLAMLNLPACGSTGIAVIMIDRLSTRKNGKVIDIRFRYACKNDNPGVDWSLRGRSWAATKSHKINVLGNTNCGDGFHSVEFQYLPEKKIPLLRSVLVVCADE